MRQHRRIPDEKWLVARLLDEFVNRRQPFATDGQARIAVTTVLGRALRHRVGEAGGLYRITLPPFAGLQRQVTVRNQIAHEVGLSREVVDDGLVVARVFCVAARGHRVDARSRQRGIVAGDAVLMRVKPGRDARQ